VQSALDAGALPGSTTQTCPACGATIPVHQTYVTWCDHCDWNIRPQPADTPDHAFARIYDALGRRFSHSLLDEMTRLGAQGSRLTLSKIAAYLLAGSVHSIGLGFAMFGVFLLLQGWPNLAAIFGGVLCLGIAWLARPALGKLPETIVERSQAPALYALADDVARALNTRPIDVIAIESIFNASFTQVGLRRRRVMALGLPLFHILDDREKLALIGHEIAHGANGDATRSLFIASAINTLYRWHYVLVPDRIWDPTEGIRGIVAIPVNLLLLGLAQLVLLVAALLLHLLYHGSQRAEYLADHLAARVAGTDAVLGLMMKLHLHQAVDLAVQHAALDRKARDFFGDIRARVAQVPARELERLRRLDRRDLARLDVTHPPTAYRVDFLSAHFVQEPAVRLSPETAACIQQELTRFEAAVQRELRDRYRRNLYQ
jgi:Zn-dependent protease with chaperone function